MDGVIQVFRAAANPLKVAGCALACLFFSSFCACRPEQTSPNVSDIIIEQAYRMKSYMDNTTEPCNDFYQFACGNWNSVNKIPDDKEQWGTLQLTETQAIEKISKMLRSADIPANIDDTEKIVIKKAKEFYASCTNKDKIEELGMGALKKLLHQLGGWPALEEGHEGDYKWLKILVETRKLGEKLLFSSEVSKNFYKSTENALYAYHPLLGLWSRHFYLNETKELKAYRKLIVGVLKRIGAKEDRIDAEVADILNFEKQIARISTDSNEVTDLAAAYNPSSLKELIDSYPNIDWLTYYTSLHNRSIEPSEVVIASKAYLKELNTLIGQTKARQIVNYLVWRIVQKYAPFTGAAFEKDFEVFTNETIGVSKPPPKEVECTKYAIEYLSPGVGALYIPKHFEKASKQDAENMLLRLKATFRQLTKDSNWLDQPTKSAALEKLDRMGINVGYPNNIMNPSYLQEYYTGVSITTDDFFSNVMALTKVKNSQDSKKIGQPVDKGNWDFGFLSANAAYSYPSQAVFIAALMFRPPLYHKDFPKFLNFGLLGTITAHEMSHAFDSKGITFDQYGYMKPWFSNSSLHKYKGLAKCFIDKYGNLSRNDVHLNGEAILQEAIADDAAVKTAFIAYKKWIRKNINSPVFRNEILPGLDYTKEKMFFLSFAQIHCNSIRETAWPVLWETDNHALANYRVNTVLSNSKEFLETFQCSPKSPMNSKEKCAIW